MVKFEVQTYTICDGWVNCWSEDGEPVVFDTHAAALEELYEHFRDLEEADMSFSPDDYRIVELTNPAPEETISP